MPQYADPTPRNRLWGLLADAVQGTADFAGKPFGFPNPPGQMLASGLGLNDLATVLDRASYGERMTKGSGQTLQLRDEVPGALGALLPGATAVTRIGPKAIEGAAQLAAAGARNLAVPRQMSTQAGKVLAGGAEQAAPVAAPVFDLSNPIGHAAREQAALPRYEPARGVPDRVARLQNNQGAKDKVAEWMADGMTDDGLGWYNMEPLRKAFVAQHGEEAGTQGFQQYMDLMAATSAGAKTDANARIASYYYVNGQKGGIPVPPIGSGYGHKVQKLHNKNANEILEGGALDPIQNPKRFSFGENLKGNYEPVAVDKHNIRGWGMASRDPEWLSGKLETGEGARPSFWDDAQHGAWDPQSFSPRGFQAQHPQPWESLPPTWFEGTPKANEYGALEGLNQHMADVFGVQPAEGQAAMWLGAGPTTGLGSPPVSMMNTFEQMLQKRAKARGQPPQEVLDQFINRVRPLMVPAAAAGLGAAMYGQQGAPDDSY